MRIEKKVIAMGMVLTVLFTGCQKAPENSIVKNKSFDNMVSQANDAENGYDNPESMAEKYDTYRTEFSDKKLHVNVEADAKVEIPKTNKMSVYRIKQKKIDQEFMDKVKKTLGLEETLYDGSVTQMKTKSEIEKEIQGVKKAIKDEEENGGVDKEGYEEDLENLQKEYGKAPKKIEWDNYVSSGKLESVKKQYNKNQDDRYYSWQYSLNPNGDSYYGVTDGKNGYKKSLYVQNSEEYSNSIRYHSSRNVYGRIFVVSVGTNGGSNETYGNSGMWQADRSPKLGDFLTYFEADFDSDPYKYIEEYKNETATISEKKAHETAEKFLKDIGISDFKYSEGGLYYELVDPIDSEVESGSKKKYRNVYYIKYLRNIDGVQVNNESGSKHQEGEENGDYVKKDWCGEKIELMINDDGIVTFDYDAPIEKTETVVDQTKMKGFEKAKNIFEKMIPTINAVDSDSKDEVSIKVKSVVLRYMRISEENSFDTGLLVPVWDFMGTKEHKSWKEKDLNSKSETSLLTVNAIDGTVIDKGLGY